MSQNEAILILQYGDETAFPSTYSLFYNFTLAGEPKSTEEDPLILLADEVACLRRL